MVFQKIRLKRIPKRNENISWREFGAETILLDPRSGDYFAIDEVGIMIWKQLDGSKTMGQIVEEIAPHFDVHENLSEDIIEFLEELRSHDLISVE